MAKEKTQFEKDNEKLIDYNGKEVPAGIYNLLLSIRDVSLFCKGMKIHRNWRLKDVKCYFGVTGSKEKVLEQLKSIKEEKFAEINKSIFDAIDTDNSGSLEKEEVETFVKGLLKGIHSGDNDMGNDL